jgi:hypothetical protein
MLTDSAGRPGPTLRNDDGMPQKAYGEALLARLQMIFRSLMVAQVIFLLVGVLVMASVSLPYGMPYQELYLIFVPIGDGIVIGWAYFFERNALRRAKRLKAPRLKLRTYFLGRVTRLAMINGTNLFNLVMLNWTGLRWFLLLFGLVLFLYVRLRPTREHCIHQLALSEQESARLFD